MRYFKSINNGYIKTIGTGTGGTEITEEEYNEILAVFARKPQSTATKGYRLTEELEWESFDIEPQEDEPTAEEVVDILLGVSE